MLCCAVLCCAALRCVALRCVALRCVVLRYVTLRYVMLQEVKPGCNSAAAKADCSCSFVVINAQSKPPRTDLSRDRLIPWSSVRRSMHAANGWVAQAVADAFVCSGSRHVRSCGFATAFPLTPRRVLHLCLCLRLDCTDSGARAACCLHADFPHSGSMHQEHAALNMVPPN